MTTQTTKHNIILTLHTPNGKRTHNIVSTVNGLDLYFEIFKEFPSVGNSKKVSVYFYTDEERENYIKKLSADKRIITIN